MVENEAKGIQAQQIKAKYAITQKALAKFLTGLLILVISIGTPVMIVLALAETFSTANAAIDAVEPYCAARYYNDVKAYKTCTKCQAGELLNSITNEINSARGIKTTK